MNKPTSPSTRVAHTSGGAVLPLSLANTLGELARQLQTESTDERVLDAVSLAAVREIPGAEWAGVTVYAGGNLTTAAASDPFVRDIDKRQFEIGRGPCVEAANEGLTVRADDLEDDQRWGDFSRAAVELGVRAMLSFQLFVQERDLGALNIYASKPYPFHDESETVGLLIAAHASVALANVMLAHNLRVALDSRDVIGQAKGILMERYKLTGQQAFELLVGASQTTHRKLRQVAEDVTETGELSSGE